MACGGFTQGTPASEPGSVNTLTAPATMNRPDQVVKAERNFYDDPAFATTFPQATAPTKGDVTMTQAAKDYTGGAYTWQTTERTTYDSYGRVVDEYDANGNKTTTGYTMNAVNLVTGTSTTNPAGHVSSATVNPRRGHSLTTTDPNDIVTRQQYDALGRATAIWLNSRPTTSAANYKFAYTVSKTGVTATTTDTLNNSNGYQRSVTIKDWAVEHKEDLAGAAVGVVVGVGCTAITGGAGAVVCGAIGGMLSSGLTGYLKGERGIDLAVSFGSGALLGALGGGVGNVVGAGVAGLKSGLLSGAKTEMGAAMKALVPEAKESVRALAPKNVKAFIERSRWNIDLEAMEIGQHRQNLAIATDILTGALSPRSGVVPAVVSGSLPGNWNDVEDIVQKGWQFKPENTVGPLLGGGFS